MKWKISGKFDLVLEPKGRTRFRSSKSSGSIFFTLVFSIDDRTAPEKSNATKVRARQVSRERERGQERERSEGKVLPRVADSWLYKKAAARIIYSWVQPTAQTRSRAPSKQVSLPSCGLYIHHWSIWFRWFWLYIRHFDRLLPPCSPNFLSSLYWLSHWWHVDRT